MTTETIEIQQIIFEFDPTYRDVFDKVVKEMNTILEGKKELQFKKKYQNIFGDSSYGIVHRTESEYGHIRVALIQPQYEGCNSVLLTPFKVLLFMKISNSRNIHTNELIVYDDYEWDNFHQLHVRIVEIMYEDYTTEDYTTED